MHRYPHATDELIARIVEYTDYKMVIACRRVGQPSHLCCHKCVDRRAICPLVATLQDVAGEPLSHTYRFILDPPIIGTPYLYANIQPPSFSSSDHLGCFNADPDRRLLMLEIGMPILNPDESLRNTCSTYLATCSYPTSSRIPYFHIRHPRSDHAACRGGNMGGMGPGPHAPDDGAESIRTTPSSRSAESMWHARAQ